MRTAKVLKFPKKNKKPSFDRETVEKKLGEKNFFFQFQKKNPNFKKVRNFELVAGLQCFILY